MSYVSLLFLLFLSSTTTTTTTTNTTGLARDFVTLLRKLPFVNSIIGLVLDGEVSGAMKLLAGQDDDAAAGGLGELLPIPEEGMVHAQRTCICLYTFPQDILIPFPSPAAPPPTPPICKGLDPAQVVKVLEALKQSEITAEEGKGESTSRACVCVHVLLSLSLSVCVCVYFCDADPPCPPPPSLAFAYTYTTKTDMGDFAKAMGKAYELFTGM